MDISVILEILFTNVPLISTIIIITGAIKLFGYYKLFGVSIFGFIELKEIPLLFVTNLLAFFSILCFIIFIIILYQYLSFWQLMIVPLVFLISTFIYYKSRKFVFKNVSSHPLNCFHVHGKHAQKQDYRSVSGRYELYFLEAL